jgi:hypothetical protein
VTNKIRGEPHARDRGNALDPDATLGNKVEPEHWRAPRELAGMTLHLPTGHALAVPPSGIVEINPAHHEVREHLRARGFKRMHELDKAGRAVDGSNPVALFRPSRLTAIGADTNFLAALRQRAEKAAQVPSEIRCEVQNGPGPRPAYARSREEFHKIYFGREA